MEVVKYLISKGADRNRALPAAAQYGKLNIIKYLISQGVDARANNNNAFKMAVGYEQPEVVKYLFSLGADPPSLRDVNVSEYMLNYIHLQRTQRRNKLHKI